MELQTIFQTVWKRLWLIVLGTLLVSVAAFVVSRNMQPIYQAKLTLTVDQSADVPLAYRSITMGADLALTYSKLLKTRPILEIVIANLDLDLSPGGLKGMLGTNLIANTQLLELTVEDTDAQRASNIANEVAFTFISLHNTERQLQNIVALEQDVVAQMANLKELIAYNQSLIDQARTSSDLLAEGEANARQSALSGQLSSYANLLGTYLSIQLTQSQFFDVTVVEPAIAPTKPIRPNIVFNTFVGAFVGLNLGVGLAFLLEHLKRPFETYTDVRQILSLPTLGTVPRLRGKQRNSGLVTSTFPRAPVSEAYRTLRTNIRFAGVDEPLTTLLVTSAEPGVGKTTVAANLSVVCAQAGLRVALIDTDLRLPNLHQLFDLDNHTGLTNLLVDDVHNVEECMLRTKIDNLRLITSGPIPPNPSELLGSKKMKAVLAEVQRNADLIILDAPPTLAVTDA
ncbi:MAG: polysaccharide biosynthesis tyrosine autokinase, partial [Candidatus Eisenbacteria sp.]|nr:polysaccharide biosynthesis tyrosine autokinase [Candidatus Eisenbacteria bacterium]